MTPPVPAQSRFVVHDDLNLHHLDWGNHGGHPVILVHGIRLHAHVWNNFARRFSDQLHILALDQRGHGDSGWGGADSYQLEDFYRDLRAVVTQRGLTRFTLIGHSLGGLVSMVYAHRHPEDLERLVLVDITAGLPEVAPGTDPASLKRRRRRISIPSNPRRPICAGSWPWHRPTWSRRAWPEACAGPTPAPTPGSTTRPCRSTGGLFQRRWICGAWWAPSRPRPCCNTAATVAS
ncbi:MAG: alpha/beta hydrolase [Pseudomonadota bacterium]